MSTLGRLGYLAEWSRTHVSFALLQNDGKAGGQPSITGAASIDVDVDVPFPFSAIPKQVLEATGDTAFMTTLNIMLNVGWTDIQAIFCTACRHSVPPVAGLILGPTHCAAGLCLLPGQGLRGMGKEPILENAEGGSGPGGATVNRARL